MGRSMKIESTAISGVAVVDTNPATDHRGSFTRLFCEQELQSLVGARHIVQINRSRTGDLICNVGLAAARITRLWPSRHASSV